MTENVILTGNKLNILYNHYKDGYASSNDFVSCKATNFEQLRAWNLGLKDGENHSHKTIADFERSFK